jgi:hypothetical protein
MMAMCAFVVLFEDVNGKKFTKLITGCPCIEDATIEGDNMAEDNGWNMLQIDEK